MLPALIRRFHEAKTNDAEEVTIWGSGEPRREFLHVDDLARGLLHLLKLDDPPNLVNVGTGVDIKISELARLVAKIVGYTGNIVQDTTKPDGTPVKRTDITLIESTGWQPTISLADGIESTYQQFVQELESRELREV